MLNRSAALLHPSCLVWMVLIACRLCYHRAHEPWRLDSLTWCCCALRSGDASVTSKERSGRAVELLMSCRCVWKLHCACSDVELRRDDEAEQRRSTKGDSQRVQQLERHHLKLCRTCRDLQASRGTPLLLPKISVLLPVTSVSSAELELGVDFSSLSSVHFSRILDIIRRRMLAPFTILLALACSAPALVSSAAVEKRATLLDGFYNASEGGGSWLTVSTSPCNPCSRGQAATSVAIAAIANASRPTDLRRSHFVVVADLLLLLTTLE